MSDGSESDPVATATRKVAAASCDRIINQSPRPARKFTSITPSAKRRCATKQSLRRDFCVCARTALTLRNNTLHQ